MEHNYLKSTDALYFPEIDRLSLEEINEFMERNVCKNSIDCCNWKTDFPYNPISTFSICYSKEYLYVDFFVRCNYLKAVNYTNNSPVCQDSCVEIFLSIDGTEYWNFEFNCIGTINASRRVERNKPTRLNDAELNSIRRFASCGTRPFEEIEGLFAWNLTIAIPLHLLKIKRTETPLIINGNFYRCGDKTSLPHYLSWSPIYTPKPDFHKPEFFGTIRLL